MSRDEYEEGRRNRHYDPNRGHDYNQGALAGQREQEQEQARARSQAEAEAARPSLLELAPGADMGAVALAIFGIIISFVVVFLALIAHVLLASVSILTGARILSWWTRQPVLRSFGLLSLAILGTVVSLYGPTFAVGDHVVTKTTGAVLGGLTATFAGWAIARQGRKRGFARFLVSLLLVSGTISGSFYLAFVAVRDDLEHDLARSCLPFGEKLVRTPTKSWLTFDRWIEATFSQVGQHALWDPNSMSKLKLDTSAIAAARLQAHQVWEGALDCPDGGAPVWLSIDQISSSGEVSATFRVGSALESNDFVILLKGQESGRRISLVKAGDENEPQIEDDRTEKASQQRAEETRRNARKVRRKQRTDERTKSGRGTEARHSPRVQVKPYEDLGQIRGVIVAGDKTFLSARTTSAQCSELVLILVQ